VLPVIESRFELVRQIGAGATGVVHEAVDHETGNRVALKTLKSLDPYLLVRFKNEFRALQDLRHPNLVSFGELVERDGDWSFTMELVDGVDFIRWVRRDGGGFDEAKLRDGLAQLSRALVTLHDAGMVHRDVKPSNILVDETSRLVLLDFGFVAGVQGDPDLEPGWTVGTPDFMAPEQARGRTAGPAADWYAVGTALYLALTRTLPFTGTDTEVMTDKQTHEPPPPSTLVDHVPPDLDQLCVELLRVVPAQRPTGRDVLAALGVRAERRSQRRSLAPTEAFGGRAEERAILYADFERAATECRIVSICGASGVGKSALVRQAIRDAEASESGAVALVGHCYERESVPFKAVDELVDAVSRRLLTLDATTVDAMLPEDTPLLAHVFPVLRRLAPIARMLRPADVADPMVKRSRVFQALKQLLATLAERERLIMVIEDLQWADADSRSLLRALVEAPAPKMLLMVTERDESAGWLRGAVQLRLGPLSLEESTALAERLGAKSAAQIAADAEGHPMFIEELVRYARAGGERAAPGALGTLVSERLDDLPVGARHILEIVCIAGAPLEQEVAARAAGMDFGAFQERVASLRVERLVRTAGLRRSDPIMPFHEHVRDAAIERMPRPIVAGCHEALALAMEAADRSDPADPEALAHHWRGAGHLDNAREYTERAAKRAASSFAFARAADLYRAVLELEPPDEASRRRVLLALGDMLENAGRAREAAEVFLQAVAAAPLRDFEAVSLRLRAADQLLRAGHVTSGLQALRRVFNAVGIPMPDSPRASIASVLVQRARLAVRGLRFVERPEAEVPREELLKVDAYWAAANAFTSLEPKLAAVFHARHLLAALGAGEPVRIARALTLQSASAVSRGGPSNKVQAMIDIIERLADSTRSSFVRALLEIAQAFGAVFPGRWADACEHASVAEHILTQECTGVTRELALSRLLRMWGLIYLGELRTVGTLVDRWIREAEETDDRYSATTLRIGIFNIHWLARDDVAGAREAIEHALSLWPEDSYLFQHYQGLFAHIHIDLYAGDPDAAWARIGEHWPAVERAMLLRLQFARINMLHARGRAAVAAAAAASSRGPFLRTAGSDVRSLSREGIPYASAYAALLDAGIARLQGDTARAVAQLERSSQDLASLSMPLHAAIARRRLGSIRGGGEGETLVTSADQTLERAGVVDPARFADLWAPGF
jgi:tetratricopeptide (TPR) repeat protein